jgi:hypothetical protein
MKLLVEPIFKTIQVIWLDKLAGNICKNKKKCMAFSLENKSLGNFCSNFYEFSYDNLKLNKKLQNFGLYRSYFHAICGTHSSCLFHCWFK